MVNGTPRNPQFRWPSKRCKNCPAVCPSWDCWSPHRGPSSNQAMRASDGKTGRLSRGVPHPHPGSCACSRPNSRRFRLRELCIVSWSLCFDTDFKKVIIGRTDAAQVLGMEEAVARLQLASEAGADVCFIEGVKTDELLRSTVAALAPRPVRRLNFMLNVTQSSIQVLVNVISGGLTPSFTSDEAEKMGAKIISELSIYTRKVAWSHTNHPLKYFLWFQALQWFMASEQQ